MGNSAAKELQRAALRRLSSEKVLFTEDEFWDSILNSSISISEIKEILSADVAREIRDQFPANLTSLFKRILLKLRDVIQDGFVIILPEKAINSALTCIRLVAVLVPFILEEKSTGFAEKFFWSQDHEEDSKQSDESLIIGVELLEAIHRLLFLPGFSIHVSCQDAFEIGTRSPVHILNDKIVWKGGVGCDKNAGRSVSGALMNNRIETLLALLACLSEPLYSSVKEYQEVVPLFQKQMGLGNIPFTACLFASLLNVVFSYSPTGYGVPYGHAVSSNTEERLVRTSTQVLCALLDFNPSIWTPEATTTGNSGSAPPSPTGGAKKRSYGPVVTTASTSQTPTQQDALRNVYRLMFQEISKPQEILLLIEGFNLLCTSYNSKLTYLPKSKSQLDFHEEILLLFWQALCINSDFFAAFTHNEKNIYNIVTALLYTILEASRGRRSQDASPSKDGVVHLSCFILLLLSSSREFAIKLNEPFLGNFPLNVTSFQGSYSDLFIIVIHQVILENLRIGNSTDSQIDMLLTSICNISPYTKSFCLESCTKIMSLTEKFAKPNWLFGGPHRNHAIFFLLDVLSNVVQYQYEGNQRLVYTILRQRDVFLELKDLDLNSYLTLKENKQPKAGLENQADSSWVPTNEWFLEWKAKLPLNTILRLIDGLLPQVEEECLKEDLVDQKDVLAFLKKTTMVGILPVPHAIIIRNYQTSRYTDIWTSSYFWGLVLSKVQEVPSFDWRKVKLISVETQEV
eukprot:GHVP01060071.1.p1 GENE.GHVP01060071.1~~GHVP01060071.1.p1  ORF type:complete len:751 (-),score=99.74 GHVP01060071.1:6138-8363(-)